MHDRLTELLDRVDAVLAMAVECVQDHALEPTALSVRRIRNRLDYPEDLALVALVGGTGSGKSSLFNAILDTDRAEVGGLRPTTERALVSVPAPRRGQIEGYLQFMGELEKTEHSSLSWLVLLDLPDTDSVAVDHRLQVANLLPFVDAVVWVVDVEKYRDGSLHRGFLQGLVPYESQFLFVLNQIDRVPAAEVDSLVTDFESALLEDGFAAPEIMAVAASPPLTSPRGLEDLVRRLERLGDGSAMSRALIDLEMAVTDLKTKIGGSSLDFERRWSECLSESAGLVVDGDVLGASRRLAGFFLTLADELVGSPVETALGLSAHVGEELRSVVRKSGEEFPRQIASASRWFRRAEQVADPMLERRRGFIVEQMDSVVDPELRPQLRHRAITVANLAGLAVDVADLRNSYPR